MLRGLDVRGHIPDGEPTIIKVAGREPLEAEVTLYVDETATAGAAERQRELTDALERLEAAGVLEAATVVAWQDADAAAVYEEFVGAVETASLDPFFDSAAENNTLDVPHVCVAIRDGEELTGVYPREKDGTEQHVEDCLRALCSGDRVENV